MKLLLTWFLALAAYTACERKPTEEEVARQRAAEAAKRSPSPKPGDWMWKKYRNPLDQPKR